MGATVLLGHPGSLARSASLWDMGPWAMGLVSPGWFVFALVRTTDRQWTELLVPIMLPNVARLDGNLSPFTPFAHWVVGFHGWSGSLSVAAGTADVLTWLVLCGATALSAAAGRLRAHD